ncbi:hypothetical protein [Clostridium sp. AWRP]|uniref:hypothetical protein n=1 Tax=Clostridium sp. AWRP TaxID=2212991 RepID=UPI000FD8912D|nr:hypothetical protein [Clostridium sp. AWRP]AZV58018.1 hypothetical protein DMR38_16170 [Clostridium sp. AWRP]
MKKTIIKSSIAFIVIFALFFIASSKSTVHALNCYTVSLSNFKEVSKNIYVQPNTSDKDVNNILSTISKSKNIVANLYGSFNAKPVFIISKDSTALKKFGVENKTGATQKTILGSYIVLGPEGLNTYVISHELTHSELAYRINKSKSTKIPVWFDEGMAMQVDNRPKYCEGQWIKKTQNGTKIPDMKTLNSPTQFYASDLDTRVLNYTLAKHEVHRWLSIVGQKGLLQLIDDINNGNDFYKSYNTIEKENSKK